MYGHEYEHDHKNINMANQYRHEHVVLVFEVQKKY